MAKFQIPTDADTTSGGARPLDGIYLFQVLKPGPEPTEPDEKGQWKLKWPLRILFAMPGYDSQVNRRYTHFSWAHTRAWFKTQQIFDAVGYKGKPGQDVDGEKFVGLKFGGILRTEKRPGMTKEMQDMDTVMTVADFKLRLKQAQDAAAVSSGFDTEDEPDEEEVVVVRPAKKVVNGAARPVAIASKRRPPEPEPDEDDDDGFAVAAEDDDFDGDALDDDM